MPPVSSIMVKSLGKRLIIRNLCALGERWIQICKMRERGRWQRTKEIEKKEVRIYDENMESEWQFKNYRRTWTRGPVSQRHKALPKIQINSN